MLDRVAKQRKGTARTRVGRYSETNRIYHIVTCTINREPIFATLNTGREVVESLMVIQDRGAAMTLAYVVMPDHLHWLLQLHSDHSLSSCVCLVKSRAARRINRSRCAQGPVWQRGFFDRAIRTDEDLPAIARYIVANPLRAGITDSLKRYPLWDAVWL